MPYLNKLQFKHNAKIYTKICPQCGVQYYANKPMAIYCSHLCRVNAYNDRKKLKQTPPKVIKELIKANEEGLTEVAHLVIEEPLNSRTINEIEKFCSSWNIPSVINDNLTIISTKITLNKDRNYKYSVKNTTGTSVYLMRVYHFKNNSK